MHNIGTYLILLENFAENYGNCYKLINILFLMKETRGARYGRALARFIHYSIENSDLPIGYEERLVKEIRKYSLESRKKGEPSNSGCVRELEGIQELDFENPEHLAGLVKEGIHLMYQKQTAKRVLESLVSNLEEPAQSKPKCTTVPLGPKKRPLGDGFICI